MRLSCRYNFKHTVTVNCILKGFSLGKVLDLRGDRLVLPKERAAELQLFGSF